MNLLRKLGLLMMFTIGILGANPAALADDDEKEKGKVIVTGVFGVGGDQLTLPIGDAPGHVIIQQVRTDQVQSQDWRWNGLTAKIHEQLDAYPTQGTFRIYVEFSDPSQPARGKAYGFYAGSFSVDGVNASFSAKGHLLGGTGDFDGVAGKILVDGSITPADGGRYTLTLLLKK